MDTFRAVAGTACFLGIVITMFSSLYPSEKFAKQMKMIFSLIFILSIVKPFVSGRIGFPDLRGIVPASSDHYEAVSENTYDYFIDSVERNISSSFENELNKINIYPVRIETSVNISDSGSISINEVRLVLKDTDDLPAAAECIRKAAESGVKVTAEEYVPE